MRHHTLVHKVDLNNIERSRVKKAEKLAAGEGAQKPSVPEGENKPLNQSEKSREQCHHSVCLGGEVGGSALLEVLPVVLFSEKGGQHVMALHDSGCNTTLVDEELAQSLGLKLQIQGVNAEKAFTSQHIKNCRIPRVGREGVKYVLRDVKTFPNLSGPDQKIKWSAIKQNFSHLKNFDLKDTGPVRLIIGSNNSDLMQDSHMLTEYHMQSRHLSVGQSLTGYPVKKRWHHHTMCLKCMKQVQAKRRSCSGCLLLSRK